MANKTPAPYMTLAAANFFLKYAKARGVSKVARGESKSAITKIGFMQAYAKAKGNHKKLQTMMATPRQTWDERRNNFVARHMAQVTKRGEDLYETSGKYKGWPTRRHLGLIMWAMTPDPRGVGNLIARERGLKTRTTRANGLSSRRTSARASKGKGIRIPSEWISLVSQALEVLEDAIPAYTAQRGLAEARVEGFVNLPLDAPGLSPRVRALLTDRPNTALRVSVVLFAVPPKAMREEGMLAAYWGEKNALLFAVGQTSPTIIRHELVHVLQNNANWHLVDTGRVLPRDEGGPESAVGQRRAYWRRGAPVLGQASTPPEFEAYIEQFGEDVEQIVNAHYEMIFDYYYDPAWDGEILPHREHIGSVNAQVRDFAATVGDYFEDPRARRDAIRRIVNRGAARIDANERVLQPFLARVRGERRARTVANPRYTSARRDDPELWERVKAAVTRGTKGGKAGQWSARKAQFAVAEYQRRGGGYIGPKSPRNALAKWTREEWGTKSGRASLKTGERYLPKAAREALTPAEYAETTRAKRAGLRRGEQFTRQPKRIARKTAKYRK